MFIHLLLPRKEVVDLLQVSGPGRSEGFLKVGALNLQAFVKDWVSDYGLFCLQLPKSCAFRKNKDSSPDIISC